MGHDDTANVMLDKRQGEDLLLGVLYAALGAFTFALNNVMMRRGVVTGSVLQGMALTVPIGGLSFLVVTIASGEVGQLVVFPTAAFAWLACQGVVGGFKRSSQHHDEGGCDDHSKAAVGSIPEGAIAVPRSTASGRTR
jgi:drug/metabolite transporter (DMT)-like permease